MEAWILTIQPAELNSKHGLMMYWITGKGEVIKTFLEDVYATIYAYPDEKVNWAHLTSQLMQIANFETGFQCRIQRRHFGKQPQLDRASSEYHDHHSRTGHPLGFWERQKKHVFQAEQEGPLVRRETGDSS